MFVEILCNESGLFGASRECLSNELDNRGRWQIIENVLVIHFLAG